jgi:adenylate kinase
MTTCLSSGIVNRAAEAAAAGKPVRADDNEDSLRIRLGAYYKQTSPLIGYYYAKGLLKGVDGLASIEDVAADIAATLDA